MRYPSLLHQTLVIAADELRDVASRWRTIIAVGLTIALSLFVALSISKIESTLGTPIDLNKMLDDTRPSFHQFFITIGKAELIPYFERELLPLLYQIASFPLALWLTQIYLACMIPSIAAFVSSDMIAGDLQRGTLRFLLLRSRRSSYLLGKVLAHAVLYGAVFEMTLLITAACLGLFGKFGVVQTLTQWLVPLSVTGIPFVVMSVTVTGWVSALLRRPFTVLLLVHVVWLLFIVMLPLAPHLSPLSPDVMVGLLVPRGKAVWISAAASLAWSAVFIILGLLVVRAREV